MWEWFKSLFSSPKEHVEELTMLPQPKEMVFEVLDKGPTKLPTSFGSFKRGQWAVLGSSVGILDSFVGADVMFHHVDRETGLTTKVEQISSLNVRPAKISEIPPCRMSIPIEVAKERGYGD